MKLCALALALLGVAAGEEACDSGKEATYQTQVHGDFAKQAARRASPTRFENITDRKQESELPRPCFFSVMGGEAVNNWRGIPFRKSAFDMAAYPQLLDELQPATIIELGTFHGGSTLWLADLLGIIVSDKTKLVTLDLDHGMLHPKAKAHPAVVPVECDLFKVRECKGLIDALETMPKPWLVIEDAHVNMPEVLATLGEKLTKGDYLVVEDTSGDQTAWVRNHGQFATDTSLTEGKLSHDLFKVNEVKDFVMKSPEKYAIDTYYQDMFGYNGGKAWNSFLKVVA